MSKRLEHNENPHKNLKLRKQEIIEAESWLFQISINYGQFAKKKRFVHTRIFTNDFVCYSVLTYGVGWYFSLVEGIVELCTWEVVLKRWGRF